MRISALAVRLRKVASGLEALAVRQGDPELPEETVPLFVANVVTDESLGLHISRRGPEIPPMRIPRP